MWRLCIGTYTCPILISCNLSHTCFITPLIVFRTIALSADQVLRLVTVTLLQLPRT